MAGKPAHAKEDERDQSDTQKEKSKHEKEIV